MELLPLLGMEAYRYCGDERFFFEEVDATVGRTMERGGEGFWAVDGVSGDDDGGGAN